MLFTRSVYRECCLDNLFQIVSNKDEHNGQGFLLTHCRLAMHMLNIKSKKTASSYQRYQQTHIWTNLSYIKKFQKNWFENVGNRSDAKLISDSGVWWNASKTLGQYHKWIDCNSLICNRSWCCARIDCTGQRPAR